MVLEGDRQDRARAEMEQEQSKRDRTRERKRKQRDTASEESKAKEKESDRLRTEVYRESLVVFVTLQKTALLSSPLYFVPST